MPRPREFDSDDVLDAAIRVFRAHGYEDTTVADLERELGVGRQSLYNVFGDKRGLFLAALERYGRAGEDHLRATLGDPTRGLEGIRAYFSGLVATLSQGEGGCLITRSTATTAREDEEVARRCTLSRASQIETFLGALAVAAERGELRPGVTPEVGARTLAAGAYGLGVMSAAGMPETELQVVADTLVEGLTTGSAR